MAPERPPQQYERPDRWLPSAPKPAQLTKLARQIDTTEREVLEDYEALYVFAYGSGSGAGFEGQTTVTSQSTPTEGAVLAKDRRLARRALYLASEKFEDALKDLRSARSYVQAADAMQQPKARNAIVNEADFSASLQALARRRERGEL